MFAFGLKGRGRNIVLVAASLAAAILAYNFLVRPVMQRDSFLNRQIAAKNLQLMKNRQVISEFNNVNRQYQKYAGIMKQARPEGQEMSAMLSQIETAGQGIQIRLQDMKPRDIKTADFYKVFSVDLTVEGRLNDIILFIYKLQNPPNLIRTDKLSIEKESSLQPGLKAYLQVSKILIP
jgi:Tfp pilus assembly protein PilO